MYSGISAETVVLLLLTFIGISLHKLLQKYRGKERIWCE